MSNQLYPTQYSPHPTPGALMAYRDGVFGQRPQAPYGDSLQSFQNGVFGPSLGAVGPSSGLDAGSLRAFRDGIFNFPKSLQQTPHPLTAYQDGIFGGAALGQDPATTPASVTNGGTSDPATTPSDVTNGAADVTNGGAPPEFPTGVVLDLTNGEHVAETVRFLRMAGAAADFDVSAGGTAEKTEWDAEASALVESLASQLAAADAANAELYTKYGVKRIGDESYPTGAFLVSVGMAGGAAGGMADPSMFPYLTLYLTSCMAGMFTAPPTSSVSEAAAMSEQYCPIKYPRPGISRATLMYAGAGVVGVGLIWLLMRRR